MIGQGIRISGETKRSMLVDAQSADCRALFSRHCHSAARIA
jgi:hypothetical protein